MNTEHELLTSAITTLRCLRTAAVESTAPTEQSKVLELASVVALLTAVSLQSATWTLDRKASRERDKVVTVNEAIQKDYSQFSPTSRYGSSAGSAAQSLAILCGTETKSLHYDFLHRLHKQTYLSWQMIHTQLSSPETTFIGILSSGYLELAILATFFHSMDPEIDLTIAPLAMSKDLRLAACADLSPETKYAIIYDDAVEKGTTQLYAFKHVASLYPNLHVRKTQRITVSQYFANP